MSDREHPDTETRWDDFVRASDVFSARTHRAASTVLMVAGTVATIVGILLAFGVVRLGALSGIVTAVAIGGVLGVATVFVPRWSISNRK